MSIEIRTILKSPHPLRHGFAEGTVKELEAGNGAGVGVVARMELEMRLGPARVEGGIAGQGELPWIAAGADKDDLVANSEAAVGGVFHAEQEAANAHEHVSIHMDLDNIDANFLAFFKHRYLERRSSIRGNTAFLTSDLSTAAVAAVFARERGAGLATIG